MSTSALVPCTDCGSNISRRAPVCPSCGREIRATPWGLFLGAVRLSAKTIVIYVAMIALLFAIAALAR